jgi:mono/diheme cytochrome c family protein
MEKHKIREEIDFKDLLISPIRLYGWFFVYFFLLILGFGIFFAQKLIPISFNEQTVGIIDSSLVKKEIVEKKGGIIPAVDLKSVINPTAEMIANGKKLYDGNCKSCHGDNGLGDGPAGLMMNPKPRNFHLSDGWTNGRTMDALYKTLHEGIITRGMAAYEYLPPTDRFDIIHYIRTVAEFPAVTEEQVNQLNTTYNLSAGTIQPNQIPVDKAAKIILAEHAQLNLKINAAKEKFLSVNNASVRLLLNYISDIDKALYLVISNPQLNAEQLFWTIKNAPHDYGFKPTITRISLEEFRFFLDYVKSIT